MHFKFDHLVSSFKFIRNFNCRMFDTCSTLNKYKCSSHYTQSMCLDFILVVFAGHSGCMLNYQEGYQGSWRNFWDAHCHVPHCHVVRKNEQIWHFVCSRFLFGGGASYLELDYFVPHFCSSIVYFLLLYMRYCLLSIILYKVGPWV